LSGVYKPGCRGFFFVLRRRLKVMSVAQVTRGFCQTVEGVLHINRLRHLESGPENAAAGEYPRPCVSTGSGPEGREYWKQQSSLCG
jgi:hypothetical protein